jgi:hypothetical protein
MRTLVFPAKRKIKNDELLGPQLSTMKLNSLNSLKLPVSIIYRYPNMKILEFSAVHKIQQNKYCSSESLKLYTVMF